MASPTVAARSSPSTEATDVTTHTVNLPSGIASGHLLIMFFATDGGANAITLADWTEIFRNNNGQVQLACLYKVATGTEGGTISVSTAAAQQSAHTCYRITGYNEVQIPEVSAVSNSTSSAPNPTGVTPTGGSKDYLFIEAAAIDGGVAITVASTSYTNLQAATSTGAGGVGVGTAERALTASTENPDAMTAASSDDWHARVIAVHPGTGGTGAGVTHRSRLAIIGVGG